jgi:hypothetical protein
LVSAIDEQAPQVRLRMVLGDLGQHHEPDPLAVGLDGPQPRHDGGPVDHVGEEGVGVGVGHAGDEAALGGVDMEVEHRPRGRRGDLDELDVDRRADRTIAPRRVGAGGQRVAGLVGPPVAVADRLDGHPLEVEPERLDEPRRRDVAGIQRGLDAVHAGDVEQAVDDGPHSFASQPPSLV